jgi:hypothetical protein
VKLEDATFEEIERLFLSFPSDAIQSHRSYASALKNNRNFLVLDTVNGPLFMSKKHFEASGGRTQGFAAIVSGPTHDKYLAELERLAGFARTAFSARKDERWHGHKFFRVHKFD